MINQTKAKSAKGRKGEHVTANKGQRQGNKQKPKVAMYRNNSLCRVSGIDSFPCRRVLISSRHHILSPLFTTSGFHVTLPPQLTFECLVSDADSVPAADSNPVSQPIHPRDYLSQSLSVHVLIVHLTPSLVFHSRLIPTSVHSSQRSLNHKIYPRRPFTSSYAQALCHKQTQATTGPFVNLLSSLP
jgi:hypothetical protein